MIAKGLDFPDVTLVGVINADTALHFPDFRAAERTFSLLTQVAGRAGRGDKPGKVLVQTYTPEHYALEASTRHDYAGFVTTELAFREALGYPPYGHLVNLVLSGNVEGKVKGSAERLAQRLSGTADLEVLGPAPCPLAKLRGKHRFQILLKAATRGPLHQAVASLKGWKNVVANGVRLNVDVDPMDML
jgi:primosomal protein N' (replication factor Y)